MAADGTGDRLLFDQPPKGCFRLSRPAVSPSGQLVVTCNTEAAPRTVRLLVITLEGKIVRELDEGRLGDPTVTADGRWVLYWRNDEGSEDGGSLYRTRVDGKGSPARITDGGDGEDADPAVSPDGSQLAFSRSNGDGRDILTAPFDGKAISGDPEKRDHGGQQPGPVVVAGRAADRVQARARRRRRPVRARPGHREVPARGREPRARTPCRPGPRVDFCVVSPRARRARTLLAPMLEERYLSASGRVRLVSSGMPGPMVVDTVILRR